MLKFLVKYLQRKGMLATSFLSLKWAIPILLTVGSCATIRFNEIKYSVGDITSTRLSSTLKELEKNALIQKFDFHDTIKHVEYSLTNKGKEFVNAITPILKV